MSNAVEQLVRIGTALILLCGSAASNAQNDQAVRLAIPVDPVTAIIEALKTHQVVALGERHHNLEIHELRLKLLRDPRFSTAVRDVVVEFGTPRHQDIIDRYTNGGDVDPGELRRVWTETSQGGNWDGPVYEDFYRTVREVNANLAEDRRIHVVLGDPEPLTMEAEAALIRTEVMAKGRNALILFGAMHFPRKRIFYPLSNRAFAEWAYNDPENVSTVSHLEAAGVTVFSIYPMESDEVSRVQADVAAWAVPSLAIVHGTRVGMEPFATFAPTDTLHSVPNEEGEGRHLEHVPPDPARSGLMQEQFDAVLLLGTKANMRFSAPRGSTQ